VAGAALLVPVALSSSMSFMGDMIALIYLLATVRMFTALAALDAGSTFGGMGSSREMYIAAIVEPAMLMSVLAVALVAGSTSLASVSAAISSMDAGALVPMLPLAAAAFCIALLAENSRIPFDNPATHLELTMVHEAMLLEYSGRHLAMMEYASMLKLTVFLAVLVSVFVPWGIAPSADAGQLAIGVAVFIVKIVTFSALLAFAESARAKARLFKLPDLLAMAFILALLAVASYHMLGAA